MRMTQASPGAPARGRGRPARLSRDQIVDAAVALVYEDPQTPLTIKRVSVAVDSAPMALYRYFPDRDDLLQAVADRVVAGMRFDKPAGATWQEQLRGWMLLSMEHLRPYPQLLPYIASPRKANWLPSFALLTEVLQPLSLSHEDMALAITFIGTTIVGHATLAAQRAPAGEVYSILRDALREDSADDRARVAPVLDQLPRAYERLYDMVIDSTIVAVESLSGTSPGSGHAAKRSLKAPLAPIFRSPA
jgi:TetR/AcrR family transcriptional regulator, tetracycline repressor protein